MDKINEKYRLKINAVIEAKQIIDPIFLNSSQFISDTLSDLLNLNLVVKLETSNPIRCFNPHCVLIRAK